MARCDNAPSFFAIQEGADLNTAFTPMSRSAQGKHNKYSYIFIPFREPKSGLSQFGH